MDLQDNLAKELIGLLVSSKMYIVAVESCTGGALVNALTDIPGAGDVLKDSFVTYSNDAKLALGVPQDIFDRHTVYSTKMAMAMAQAGARKSVANPYIAVGITGSLSRTDPNADNAEHSVLGQVFIAAIQNNKVLFAERLELSPSLSRAEAKQLIVQTTLQKLLNALR